MEINASQQMLTPQDPWTQIILISVICFCLPGVSHAKLSSMGHVTDMLRCTMPYKDWEVLDRSTLLSPQMAMLLCYPALQ